MIFATNKLKYKYTYLEKRIDMTLSNKITLSRIIIIPIMILVILLPSFKNITTIFSLSLGELLFGTLFVLGSFTDFLDGYLARKRNEISTFGIFLDPVADKLLTITAILYIVVEKTIYNWWWTLVVVILLREFLVMAIRTIAAKENKVIAANVFGKIKTVITMISIILILFNGFGLIDLLGNVGQYIIDSTFYLAVIATLISGVIYLIENKEIVFSE